MLNSNKLFKIAQLHKLANQSVLNGAFAIEMINNFLSIKARKTLAVWQIKERPNQKKVEVWSVKNTLY